MACDDSELHFGLDGRRCSSGRESWVELAWGLVREVDDAFGACWRTVHKVGGEVMLRMACVVVIVPIPGVQCTSILGFGLNFFCSNRWVS